jgi:hypothetical protein
MTGDLRLVYFVDCISEFNTTVCDGHSTPRMVLIINCRDKLKVVRLICEVKSDPVNTNLNTAIKILGVYTHAQLNKNFWESAGHQLSRSGAEHARQYGF